MDKIIIQESLAPLIAALKCNDTGSNSGSDGGSGTDDNIDKNPPIMQSYIIDRLSSEGHFIHNPGTEESEDNVVIKPQDLNGYELPTGRNYMGRPTYQITIESPVENTLKGFYNIGSLAHTVGDIIDAKALVSIHNSYSLELLQNGDDVMVQAQILPQSYIIDRINAIESSATLSFELTRVRDNLPTEVSLNFDENGGAQLNIGALDLTAEEEFIVKNFRFQDTFGFSDTYQSNFSLYVGDQPKYILGSNRLKKAYMNIDIHYADYSYPENHLQLLHSSKDSSFEQNKLNNLIKGAHKVDALILEFTQNPLNDV